VAASQKPENKATYADRAAQQLVMVFIPGVSVVRVDILRIVYRPEGDERNAWNNILV
jgi:hypothetical protein